MRLFAPIGPQRAANKVSRDERVPAIPLRRSDFVDFGVSLTQWLYRQPLVNQGAAVRTCDAPDCPQIPTARDHILA